MTIDHCTKTTQTNEADHEHVGQERDEGYFADESVKGHRTATIANQHLSGPERGRREEEDEEKVVSDHRDMD